MSGKIVLDTEVARPPASGLDPDSLRATLRELYRSQLRLQPTHGYLEEHSREKVVLNQVRTFQWYLPHLPRSGRVLDWGCFHAPDSCLLRAALGDRFELHGCDFPPPGRFAVFHEFARLAYSQLQDNLTLPYPSGSFDAVVGSGVLEHTAMDVEALKEVYRVLRPDGVFILSYLPNWLSYQEWYRRVVRRKDYHVRLYGLGELKHLLKHCGFLPVETGHHTSFWDRASASLPFGSLSRPLVRFLRYLAPVHLFSSTLRAVARKVILM